ncbi:hypothetical protein [Cystobacter ferrugineus]|uniref:Uncharacterized protein n=1 Tax=Cystobacter ferrugineus TaxID=83449 RepID=A0A1L9AXN6_9BACT|nr:hypothetical protein [Cystobacter ferrugineus]OJH34746.1 hypothetical protein BON30_42075 [Cystobacter ferrugineus]
MLGGIDCLLYVGLPESCGRFAHFGLNAHPLSLVILGIGIDAVFRFSVSFLSVGLEVELPYSP